jgi:rubrerythrin
MRELPKKMTEIAALAEEAGIRFYSSISTQADDEKVKKIFVFMANQEREHAVVFRSITEKMMVDDEIYGWTESLRNRIALLLDLLKKSAIDITGLAKREMTVKESIDISIGLEERAIKMYKDMTEFMDEPYRSVISRIIAEENGHLSMLKDVKSKAKF